MKTHQTLLRVFFIAAGGFICFIAGYAASGEILLARPATNLHKPAKSAPAEAIYQPTTILNT